MLQIGFGAADITPPVGANLPGNFFPRANKGAREPLRATACVVHDGTASVALVGCDILWVGRALVRAARERITAATRIPSSHVLINASHTHSGGPVPWQKDDDSDSPYRAQVVAGIADAVTQAWGALHGAEIGIGAGREDSILFNRRFRMRDGRTITHPGKPGTKYHDQIVAVEGPVDPEVGVLAVRRPGGAVTGLIVNFACHSTVVGGDLASPDYAGYLRKHLQAHFGAATAVVFLLGACGDVTQVDNQAAGRESGVEHADLMGRKLAAEAARTVGRMTWLKEAPLAAVSSTVALNFRPDPDVERERPPYGLGSAKDWEPVYARDRQWLATARAKAPTFAAEVQAVRIGPLAIVTNGSEFFASDGLRVKAASGAPHTWVATLTNDALGYVPPADACAAGGYEPRTGCHSFLAGDSAQRLIEAMLAALGRVATPGR